MLSCAVVVQKNAAKCVAKKQAFIHTKSPSRYLCCGRRFILPPHLNYKAKRMAEDRIESWVSSYKSLAEKIIACQVMDIQAEFPDEKFPVRPPYRKAMYHRLMVIVDELNWKMDELLKESPDETDAALKERLMALQESYEHDFIRQVRKEDDKNGQPE